MAKDTTTTQPSNDLLQLAVFGLQELLKAVPGLYAEFQVLFSKDAVTDADWAALRAKVAGKTYEDYVPASDLPKT